MVEVETAGNQFFMAHFVFSRGVYAHQDAPVPAQDVVDTPHVTDVITVQTIIIGNAAKV
jgi:hypothetical protein